ncbi:MAG: hypothetical protein ACO3ND_09540 [Opitutales bacterium]
MTPLVIVLGASGSGRTAVVKELAEQGWPEGAEVRVLRESREASEGALTWTFTDGVAKLPPPGGSESTIVVTCGSISQVDQMEALHAAVGRDGCWQVKRVVTVVDCLLAHRRPELTEWYAPCVHFSDVVVLNRRWEAPGRSVARLLEPYEKQFYPCLFINFTKAGRLANPAEVIEGEPLRMSHVFDDIDPVDEMEFDEDNLPDEPFDLVRQPDKYFARDELGRRRMVVPDAAPALRAEGRI